jgi:cytochrome d ubiquinol oxidase subunit I
MQTPVGWAMNAQGQYVPAAGWWEIVFNPSFPYRLVHTVIAAYLTTALVVGGVGAWHMLKGRRGKAAPSIGPEGPSAAMTSQDSAPHNPAVRTMFSMAMWMAALVAPVQIFVGDLHGLNTMEHQPAKVMAMEGHFESYPDGAPLILIGMPDSEAEKTRVLLEIPSCPR